MSSSRVPLRSIPSAGYKHLYSYRWQKASKAFLAKHPLCECPHCDGGRIRTTLATVVDHKVPHRGDRGLFWDRDNWQPMGKACHDSYKARLERSGTVPGAGLDGVPVDPTHHWHKPKG